MRMVAEPHLNQYTSKETGKPAEYVSYTVKAVMDQNSQRDLYATINAKSKAMNQLHLPQRESGVEGPAVGREMAAPAAPPPSAAAAPPAPPIPV